MLTKLPFPLDQVRHRRVPASQQVVQLVRTSAVAISSHEGFGSKVSRIDDGIEIYFTQAAEEPAPTRDLGEATGRGRGGRREAE